MIETNLHEAEDRHKKELRQLERDDLQKEAEFLRKKQAAKQREKEVSPAVEKLEPNKNIITAIF